MVTVAMCATGCMWKTIAKAIDLVVREGVEGEVYNVGGHNEKTNLEIVKLTIATIHRLMTEKPEYREVLKKKVKDEMVRLISAGLMKT